MVRTSLPACILAVCALATHGCGGGSSGAGGSGGLSFRAVWQQPSAARAGGAAASVAEHTAAAQTVFGSGIPSTVSTVRITFDSDTGQRCCVAIDPTRVADGVVILAALQAGGATVRISGFSTSFAPTLGGAAGICVTEPASAAKPCDASRQAAPNFDSGPQRVSIIAGQETDAGDIVVAPVATPTPPVAAPTSTPTATPTLAPTEIDTREPTTIIVRPPQSIASAARRAPPGSTIIAAPGAYAAIVLGPGDLHGPLTLIADVTGVLTESAPAAVTVNANRRTAALRLTEQSNITIDGFTFRDGAQAGVLVESSSGISLLNCVVTANRGDGVRYAQSQSGLIFDTLIFQNPGAGIRLVGTSSVEVINVTAYKNLGAGITVSDSADSFVENSILNENTPAGIVVDPASAISYQADFNLNTDGYGEGTPTGASDIHGPFDNPLFIAPERGDFHLATGIAGSTSPAIDVGDPDTDPQLVSVLAGRTTQTDGTLDSGPVDLGYHYPPPIPTPVLRSGS